MEEEKKKIEKAYLKLDNPILEEISKIVGGKRGISED
jgi:hypothetical protein